MRENSKYKPLLVLQRITWALFLLVLPVTSFPFFPPAFGGEALVRPLSIYPMILLVLLVILPRLITRPIPKTILPLIPFVIVAIASSLLSLLRGIEPVFGIAVNIRVLRGVVTLAIGCTFYLTTALIPENIDDLRFSLRWIYVGIALAMCWGSFQAINILLPDSNWFAFLEKAQSYISIRRLHPDRIVGLTYEPHWFAEQINLLLIPWSLGAILTNYSVFYELKSINKRWHFVKIEWLLLGCSILIIPFTYSRSGLISLVILILVGVLLFRPKDRTGSSFHMVKGRTPVSKATVVFGKFLQFFLSIVILFIPIYFIGSKNLFFSRLWNYWRQQNTNLTGYFSSIGLDARIIYSQAAFRTYENFPLLGVGLGNYAFYFAEMLPYRPIAEVPEVLSMITPESGKDRLITSKNLYLRLLAETGIVGACTFLAFVIAILGCALYLWLSSDKECQYWGTASLLGLLAFAFSALTFDSFVIPNMWVVFGLITAAIRVTSRISKFPD